MFIIIKFVIKHLGLGIYIYIYARCSDNWKDYKKGKRGGESAPNSQKEEMVLVTLKMQ